MNSGKKSIIHINGQAYDAATGQTLSTPARTHQVMDILPTSASTGIRIKAPRPSHPQVHHAATAHKLQKSQTLMRQAVKKPQKQHIDFLPAAQPTPSETAIYTYHAQDHARAQRAQTITKSTHVERYSSAAVHARPTLQPLSVVERPFEQVDEAPVLMHIPQPIQTNGENFIQKQLSTINGSDPAESPFKKKKLHARASHSIKKHKALSLSTVLMSLVLLAGLLTYLNLPTIALAVASKKADIALSTPKGIPASFSLDRQVYATPGQLTLTYRTHTDDRTLTLTLIKANQTPQTLKEEVSTKSKGQYQTYEVAGKTIYITSNNRTNAEWMDNGIRYSIFGSTQITADQISAIAQNL